MPPSTSVMNSRIYQSAHISSNKENITSQYPDKCPFTVKATYSWSGEEKSDLGFLEGDVIEVLKVKGKWFWGKLLRNKKCGSFPSNYVQVTSLPSNKDHEYNRLSKLKTGSSKNKSVSHSDKILQNKMSGSQDDITSNINRRSYRKTESAPTTPSAKKHVGERIANSKNSSKINIHKQMNQMSLQDTSMLSPNDSLYKEKYSSLAYNISYQKGSSPQIYMNNMSPTKRNSHIKSITTTDDSYASTSSDNSRYSNLNNDEYVDSYFNNIKYFNETSNTTSSSMNNSILLLSNFSATSAGSFARHKFAKSFTDSKMKQDLPNAAIDLDMNSSFIASNSNNKIKGNNKFFSNTPDLPRLSQMVKKNLSSNDISNKYNGSFNAENDESLQQWAFVNKFLNRGNSLNGREKYDRRMKFLESGLDTDLILEPHLQLQNKMSENQVLSGTPSQFNINDYLSNTDFENFDEKVIARTKKDGVLSLESFALNNFGHRYMNSLERLRAIYVFCTETYQLIDDNGSTDFRKPATNLDKVLHKNYCTPYELTWLFKKLSNHVGIKCDIVIGFLKTPDRDNLDFQLNHCWLSCIIKNEYRFIDAVLGNVSNPIHEYVNDTPSIKCEDFYFLTEPKKLIYSHIPYKTKEQHLTPEIDNLVPMSLPVVFPSYFKNELEFYRFDNSLSYMTSNDCYEMSFLIKDDIEIFATVVPDDNEDNYKASLDLSLVQIKWIKNKRIAVIKAILPKDCANGSLHIHSGTKGLQDSLINIHPLSCIIPLKQKVNQQSTILADEIQYEFVRITPSITSSNMDIYVKKPQNKILAFKNEYNLQVVLQPSDGIIEGHSGHKRVVVKSPSGKIYKMTRNDPNNNIGSYGIWETKLKIVELGTWNGLITNDSGAGWTSFCEWNCI